MTKRFRSALTSAPLCVVMALFALPVEARPDATTAKATTATGSAATSTGASSSTTRATPGTARPIGPTSVTGADAVVARATTIQGSAWTADNAPIPLARVRLRNVITGRLEATSIANEAGQFTFGSVEGGSYLVELVSESGRLRVAGHVFSIAPGETVATFVRLGTKVPWFNGFFGNTLSAVSSSAAGEGITAIAPVARSVSANR